MSVSMEAASGGRPHLLGVMTGACGDSLVPDFGLHGQHQPVEVRAAI